jgi:hypothetical protein
MKLEFSGHEGSVNLQEGMGKTAGAERDQV